MGHRLPPLEKLLSLCRKMYSWLKTDKKHVIVIHCQVMQKVAQVCIAVKAFRLSGLARLKIQKKIHNSVL